MHARVRSRCEEQQEPGADQERAENQGQHQEDSSEVQDEGGLGSLGESCQKVRILIYLLNDQEML